MIIAEPTFIASLDGLCGFILEVEDGEVDAFTPSGDLLGVFHDRIEAAEAVLMQGRAAPAATAEEQQLRQCGGGSHPHDHG
jgi:hypothetical protein